MKIKLEINPNYKEIELHICNNEDNQQVRTLLGILRDTLEHKIMAYDENERRMVASSEIIRIYSQNKNVYVTTEAGNYRLRERLYELEEQLEKSQFVRISNSEIVNLHKVKRLDTSITGTIRMYLEGNIETYVSRRYMSKMKQVLGIGK